MPYRKRVSVMRSRGRQPKRRKERRSRKGEGFVLRCHHETISDIIRKIHFSKSGKSVVGREGGLRGSRSSRRRQSNGGVAEQKGVGYQENSPNVASFPLLFDIVSEIEACVDRLQTAQQGVWWIDVRWKKSVSLRDTRKEQWSAKGVKMMSTMRSHETSPPSRKFSVSLTIPNELGPCLSLFTST